MAMLPSPFLFLLILFPVSAHKYIEFGSYEALVSPKAFSTKAEEYLNNSYAEISEKCRRDLESYVEGFEAGDFWALQMFDANGKIPPGILSGHTGDIGSFDQCVKVEANSENGTIYGKYCMGFLLISVSYNFNVTSNNNSSLAHDNDLIEPSVTIPPLSSGVCSPNSCSPSELQGFYLGLGVPMLIDESTCQDQFTGSELSRGAIATIIFLSIVFCIMTLSTIYDVILHYKRQKASSTILVAFSAFTNFRKLVERSKNPNQISSLHGIRMVSLMYVILVHHYGSYRLPATTNTIDALDWAQKPSSMIVMGAHVVVDTFLLLSGFLISYGFMVAAAKGAKLNIPLYYLHRYLRLTPALGALVLVQVTLLPYLGSGPYWPLFSAADACGEYWWSTLLYVQNYVNPGHLCLGHTHYLSVDTQLFLLSPLLLIPLKKRPKLTMHVTGFLVVLSTIGPGLTAWFYKLRPVTVTDTKVLIEPKDYQRYFYYATHVRAVSWLIGFALGYIVYETKSRGIGKLTNNKCFPAVNFLLWCASLGTIAACVYSWHNLVVGEYDRLGNTLQISLVRPAWSLALSWIIFSSAHGYGGPVNWLLSSPLCQFISKLSYSVYLLHSLVLALKIIQTRGNRRFSHLETLYVYGGDLVYSTLLSIVWVLAFESPVVALEKVMLGGAKSEATQSTDLNKENGTKEHV